MVTHRPKPPSGKLSRRRSKVDQLPPEIRGEIDRCLEEGWTLDDVVAHLKILGIEDGPSRSSIDRWNQANRDAKERIRQVADFSAQIARELGSKPDEEQALAVVQLGRTLVGRALRDQIAGDGDLAAEEVLDFARAVSALSSARRTAVATADAIRKAREDARIEAERVAKAQAADAIEQVQKQGGISAKTAAGLLDMLGVRQ
ncbi:MAG: hypothetical protein OHK0024_24300 [Thalassobaculales bacterium]